MMQENFREGGSESRETKSVELQLAFKIKNYNRPYICADRNYQQASTTKRVAHMSVIKMDIHLQRSRALWKELHGYVFYNFHLKIVTSHPW